MTTTVFLIRHVRHAQQGVMVTGQADVALSPSAPEDLAALTRRFAGETLDQVLTSPVERAQITAAAVAGPERAAPVVEPDLRELDFGAWEGRAFADLERDPAFEGWNLHRSLHRPPGGESMLETQARMVGVLESARSRHPEGRVAMVSHGDPLKALVLFLLGLPLDSHDRFDLDPASVTAVVVGAWGSKLLSLNEKVAS
jgi:broad specificity phosphatase PhoE